MKHVILASLVACTTLLAATTTTTTAAADSNFTAILDGSKMTDITTLFSAYNIPPSRVVVASNELKGNYYFAKFAFVDDANTCGGGSSPTGGESSWPSSWPPMSGSGEQPPFSGSEDPSSMSMGSGMGMHRSMKAQEDCFPSGTNYSTTPTLYLNFLIPQMSPSALYNMGFIEIWRPATEPMVQNLELAQYSVATVPRMGYGFTGGIRVQVESGSIAGSVCSTGTVQNSATAITLCDIMNPDQMGYSNAALFKGAVVDGGFISIAGLSSSNGMLQAASYNNFTHKGDTCTHAADLGIICGADTFTTTDPADADKDVVYTVVTANTAAISLFIEDATLGLIPSSIVSVTPGTGSATFKLTAGNMDFTKHDLNGVLQSMSPLLWSSADATVSWNINVTFKEEALPSGNPSSGSWEPSSGEPSGGIPAMHIDAYLFTAIVTTPRTTTPEMQLKSDLQMYHNISENRIVVQSSTSMTDDFSKIVFYFMDDAETCPNTYESCNDGQTDWMYAHHLIIAINLLMQPASSNLDQLKIVQLWSNVTDYPMGPSMASSDAPMISPSMASFVIGRAEYSPSSGSSGEAPRIGHVKLQLEANTMWGSVCSSGTSQEAAMEVCKWMFPNTNITVAAFFNGDSAQGFIAASGLMMSTTTSTPALHAAATSNFTQINTGAACNHMYDLAVICNAKAVVTSDPDAMNDPITYTVTTSMAAAEVPSVIETITLGTVPASVISASQGATQGQVTFTITAGAGGFDKVDLDGVIQMSSTWLANTYGFSNLQTSMNVMAGTPPTPTTTGQTTMSGETTTTVPGQTTMSGETTTTVPGQTTMSGETTTTVPGQTTMSGETTTTVPGQTTMSGETTTTVPGQTTTTVPGQTTMSGETTTTVPGQTTMSGETTTTVPGQTTMSGETTTTVPGQTTMSGETTTVPGQTTMSGETTMSTTIVTNDQTTAQSGQASTTTTTTTTTQAATTTTATTTTTAPPKPTLDLVVNSTVDVEALITALKEAIGNSNANVTVECTAAASGSTTKTCVVEFDSTSESAIVKEKANNQEIAGVMSASEQGTTEEGSDDDDNTMIIIIVVVVVVVVLVGAVGAFIMVKKRSSAGTGQSFMDMEQEMALNDPHSQNGAVTL